MVLASIYCHGCFDMNTDSLVFLLARALVLWPFQVQVEILQLVTLPFLVFYSNLPLLNAKFLISKSSNETKDFDLDILFLSWCCLYCGKCIIAKSFFLFLCVSVYMFVSS